MTLLQQQLCTLFLAPVSVIPEARSQQPSSFGTAFDLPWLPGPHDQLPSTEAPRQEALLKLQHSPGSNNSLQNLSQHKIAEELKAMVLETLVAVSRGATIAFWQSLDTRNL